MVSNFPHLFAAPEELSSHPEKTLQVEGFGERMLDRVREAFCGLRGHDSLLKFQRDRMFLKCVSCGHESTGWDVKRTPPTVVTRADAPRVALVRRPQLISARRTA
jgi:hypothetical protein